MFKNKKSVMENMILKQGKKWTAEIIFKRVFKNLQRTCSNKNSLPIIKNAIITNSKGLNVNKQTLKRGKRKTVVQTAVVLVSEKARFSDSWKTLIKSAASKSESGFYLNFSKNLVDSGKNISNDGGSVVAVINNKHGLKFKW